MGQFNLNDYETVKERKKRFYEKYPNGRIVAELITPSDKPEMVVFKAYGYTIPEDIRPFTGFAHEWKGPEKFVNRTSWFENCEESSIGRMLDNAGFSGNGKCSREEMLKVQAHEKRGEDESGKGVKLPSVKTPPSPGSAQKPADKPSPAAPVKTSEKSESKTGQTPAKPAAKPSGSQVPKKYPLSEAQANRIALLAKELGKTKEEAYKLLLEATDWAKAKDIIRTLEKELAAKGGKVETSEVPNVQAGKPIRAGVAPVKLGVAAVTFLASLLMHS